MSAALAEDRMAVLDRKLDFLVEEIAGLRQWRTSIEDLAADLSLVGRSAMRDAVQAFATADLHPEEIVSALKTALANARLLETAVQQLQSAVDFLEDARPILRDAVGKAASLGDSLQRKGYFQAASSGLRIGDALVRSHTAEDWRQVESSVPQLVGLLRELTKPEVLQALGAIVHGFGRVQSTMRVDKSRVALLRDLNSPDARRGVAILVEFLKVVGANAEPPQSAVSDAASTPTR